MERRARMMEMKTMRMMSRMTMDRGMSWSCLAHHKRFAVSADNRKVSCSSSKSHGDP
jgi:hypothetical protein